MKIRLWLVEVEFVEDEDRDYHVKKTFTVIATSDDDAVDRVRKHILDLPNFWGSIVSLRAGKTLYEDVLEMV